ncbi:hypothetical protein BHE74_00001485 [Ensete ventricosum]|nr:hypothetical protein BHE74_00001485 [Ensete ventricosum]
MRSVSQQIHWLIYRIREQARSHSCFVVYLLHHQRQQHDEDQRHDGQNRLHRRPRLERLSHGHIEVLLHQPEPRIVDVRQDQRPRPRRQHQQLTVDARNHPHHRHHNARASNGRHRRRTGGHTNHRRHQPCQQNWVDLRVHRHMADHVAHTAGHQHLLEATTGTDDQDDRGGRRKAGVEQLEDLLGADTLAMAKGVQRQQQRQQQRGDRVTDHVHPVAHDVAVRQADVSEGFEQHQEHRQQHGDQGDTETRQAFVFRLAGQLVHQFLGRVARDVLGDERTENRAGDDGSRQRDDQAVEDGLADVRAKHADGQQRARVRRHQAVHRREAGEQRDTDLDQRHTSAARDNKHQRDQQYKTDLEEQRDAHQERGEHHGPLNLFLAEGADQGLGDLIGTAGFGHHLAEHRAQREDDADKAEYSAETVLERLDDLVHGHTRGQAEEAGRDDQCNERVHLELAVLQPPGIGLLGQRLDAVHAGIEGQGQRLAHGRFKGGELGVYEACRHEMAGAMGHAVGRDFTGQLQKHETQARRSFAQVVAVFLFQRGTGEYRVFPGLERTAQFIAEDVEPAGTVVIVEGVAGAHLFDVRGRVEAVAFNGGGAVQTAQGFADAGLATASNTHDDQGSNRLTHETPQDADSATFARCKASAKTGFSRAVLSFFME